MPPVPMAAPPSQPHPINSVTPVIGFIDIDAFECQLYQRNRPGTRGTPCVVATVGGRIVSMSYAAKKLGINRTDTPHVEKAKAICPHLTVFEKPDCFEKQDNTMCRQGTYEIIMCIKQFLDERYPDVIMEVASADEIYLNITSVVTRELEKRRSGTPSIKIHHGIVWERPTQKKPGPFDYIVPYEPAERPDGLLVDNRGYIRKNDERLIIGAIIMRKIGAHLRINTNLYSSAGVACNKLLAKIACGLNKPKMVTVLPEESLARISADVPISSVPGMGGTVGEILQEDFKVTTMADISRLTDWDKLEERFDREKVQEITARAKGQDETPVVLKLAKDKITCNKPRGDITKVPRLKRILRNLYLEVIMFLNEENDRWNRKVEHIVVSWKTNKCEEATTKLFELRTEYGGMLQDRVLTEIKTTDNFDINDFTIIELSFCLKYWLPLRSSSPIKPGALMMMESEENDEVDSSRKLSVSSAASEDSGFSSTVPINPISNKLHVHRERALPPLIPHLSQELVGFFRMNRDLSYSSGPNITMPTLLPEETLKDVVVDYCVMKDYDEELSPQAMAIDYTTYNSRKHQHFRKWLNDYEDSLNGIHFVSAMGTLVRALKTTENLSHGEWCIYGMNHEGTIYLWEEGWNKKAKFTCRDETSYTGYLFEHLITGNQQEGPLVDGITKTFPIQRVTMGKHKLMMLGHADAIDEKGMLVQASLNRDERCFTKPNPSFVQERKLKLWGQSVLSGSTSIVVGTKDNDDVITKVEMMSIQEFSKEIDEDKCLVFFNRFLDFVQSHLHTPNSHVVKKFAWTPIQSPIVHCSVEPESEVGKLMIPKIYFSAQTRYVNDEPKAPKQRTQIMMNNNQLLECWPAVIFLLLVFVKLYFNIRSFFV